VIEKKHLQKQKQQNKQQQQQLLTCKEAT